MRKIKIKDIIQYSYHNKILGEKMMFVADTFNFPANSEASQRSRFTKDEDEKLRQLVSFHDPPNWNEISKHMKNRTARQCRERYANYLRPNLINGPWTQEEDDLLKELYEQYGPKWSFISQSFKSRSSVNIKNHHSSLISQKTNKERSSRAPIKSSSSSFVSAGKSKASKIKECSSYSLPQVYVESKDNTTFPTNLPNSPKSELTPKSTQDEKCHQLYEDMLSAFQKEEDELWSTFDESMISF